jgi:hypothetical protein
MPGLRWTPEEDAILRANSVKQAHRLLNRNIPAIKARRSAIGAVVKQKNWTAIEDRRIRKTARLPLAKIVRLFKNRTAAAISTRRIRLGCTKKRGSCEPWTGAEIRVLKQMWSTSKTADVVKALPRHPILSIRGMANTKLRLRKAKTFDMASLYEQIRSRAREDGIPLLNLAAESGCGFYILRPQRSSDAPMNFNKVAKAVEFFGGRLVIDWCDV